MKHLIKVMKALSDPGRLKILKALENRKLCVCELQEVMGLAQSTVSKHLKILEEAGLVHWEKEGPWVNYALDKTTDNPYAAEMLAKMKNWLEDDATVSEMRFLLPEIHRDRIRKSLPDRTTS
ncbi:transcriptional regulator, ArsR family [Desulfobotulus alkaliphilus]|uniref:Transcriptional regulator, ArsR family n=1 Tax=Desulfobotulus alkaliphilus TaxID=622671 RepID=A0A562RZS3_9BACT|nr:metalloregulator ArsR/SmtB family transcription factor [Desulfobotulus alkaliphilus]TWI73954.1 transcriptional regulator, ArsR family [Desulfobotulus alkaliphilus]